MSFAAAFLVAIASLFAAPTVRAQAPRVEPDDVQRLAGARWSGTLTYLDYGRNTKVSIPSQLVVTREGETA